ncbi:MAG: hypothetical protein KGI60_02085 [Patescibacteria group bacterium]|nr:hypothetical protein [Patescibacteria group bacterium]
MRPRIMRMVVDKMLKRLKGSRGMKPDSVVDYISREMSVGDIYARNVLWGLITDGSVVKKNGKLVLGSVKK